MAAFVFARSLFERDSAAGVMERLRRVELPLGCRHCRRSFLAALDRQFVNAEFGSGPDGGRRSVLRVNDGSMRLGGKMPIDTSFKFHQEPQGPQAAPLTGEDRLGPLRGLLGNQPAGIPQRWEGSGFNLIWRPNVPNITNNQQHFLQLNLTTEKLAFTDVTGDTGIANRGLLQDDIFLGGAGYLQTINDSFDNSGQHFEPGVFINVPQTTNPAEQPTIGRMGSIPHGTTINLVGQARTVGQPQIDPASITPFQIGSPDDGVSNLVHFPEENLAQVLQSRTSLNRLPGLTQAQLTNPNLFLTDALIGQTITRTTVLLLSSDSGAPGSIPDIGGGMANIGFLSGKAAPNADVPKVTCIFWIEEGTDKDGAPLVQLQYTQRVLLDFNGLSWPHITVATLRPAAN